MKLTIFLGIFAVAVFCIIGGLADVRPPGGGYDNDRGNRDQTRDGGRGQYDQKFGGDGRRDDNRGGYDRSGDSGRFIGRDEVPSHVPKVCSCPRIFLPVCGSDANTYSNACELNCKKNESHGNKNLRIVCNRACPCSGYKG